MTEGSPAPGKAPGGKGALVLVALLVAGLAAVGAWWGLRVPAGPGPGVGRDASAEARLNVLKLCGDVQSYRDEHGSYLLAGPTPAEVPQGHAVPWPEDERFAALGFHPGPRVHYQYQVVVQEDPVGEPEVSCYARGDLDGDGQNSLFRVTLDANGMTSPVHAERESE